MVGCWPATPDERNGTVDEVLARYWTHAKLHYQKHGKPTGELENIRYALRPVQALYGGQPAQRFGPLALKAVQRKMVEAGLCRNVINQRTGKIKRVFKWAASEELVPVTVYQALATVTGLQKGRTGARESAKIPPVADSIVDATIRHLPAVVADMVRFQRLTGCRPEDVRGIRPIDIDRSRCVWEYRPSSHKMEHQDRERVIFIGPRAQAVLMPYLLRAETAYCFSPADSEAKRKAERHQRRKTKVQPSQVDRSRPRPKCRPGACYGRSSYQHAIYRACDKANVPRWSPNRLRHTSATELRKMYGVEAAQVVLGHSRADVTQVYAERDFAKAAAIMGEVGKKPGCVARAALSFGADSRDALWPRCKRDTVPRLSIRALMRRRDGLRFAPAIANRHRISGRPGRSARVYGLFL